MELKAMNKNGNPIHPMVMTNHRTPLPQYVPLADVAFGSAEPVLPHALPPNSQVFPNPSFNKMLNIPGVETVYDFNRARRIF